jgi:hypothetical protein
MDHQALKTRWIGGMYSLFLFYFYYINKNRYLIHLSTSRSNARCGSQSGKLAGDRGTCRPPNPLASLSLSPIHSAHLKWPSRAKRNRFRLLVQSGSRIRMRVCGSLWRSGCSPAEPYPPKQRQSKQRIYEKARSDLLIPWN